MKTFGNVSFLEFFGNNFIKLIRICPSLQKLLEHKIQGINARINDGIQKWDGVG